MARKGMTGIWGAGEVPGVRSLLGRVNPCVKLLALVLMALALTFVFDPATPENASKPIKFDAKGKCPVYQLNPSVADAVLEKRRSEQYQMAEYIARDVAVVPSRNGVDGGMNPVFAAKLASHSEFDNNGRAYEVAGNTVAPGALPRTPTPRATAAETPPAQPETASAPVVMASVRMPTPAPLPKEGEAPAEQPKSIAGLLGNLFGGTTAEARPAAPAPESETVALRGSNTELAAKPKRASAVRTAAAPVTHPKPQEAASAKPKAVANNAAEPAPKSRAQPAERQETPRADEREMRTAFSSPPANNNGMLAGAQPVVPVGSFDSRWSGLR